MILAFFNGYGEWFLEDKTGQQYSLNDFVSYIEYDSYNRRWRQIHPFNKVTGDFKLTEGDYERYAKRRLNNEENEYFYKHNIDFVKILLPLSDDINTHDKVKPPLPDLELNYSYLFKIKKFKDNEVGFQNRLDYSLEAFEYDAPSNNHGEQKKDLDPRAETTYLHTIAALYEFIAGEIPGIEKHPNFTNKTTLTKKIDELYKGYYGLSDRKLIDTLTAASEKLKKG